MENNNIKWEDRGILLGLIYYITKNYDELVDSETIIYIKDTRMRAMMTFLFKQLSFTNNKKKADFIIRIKHHKIGDLNINNLNNFSTKISIKKYYLLPWFDKDNPLIMYTSGVKLRSVKELKSKIKKTISDREQVNGTPNFITDASYNIWDSQVEYNILSQLGELFNISPKYLYTLITNFLLMDISNADRSILEPSIVYQKVEVPTVVKEPPIIKYIKEPIDETSKSETDDASIEKNSVQFDLMIDLINNISNKISSLKL